MAAVALNGSGSSLRYGIVGSGMMGVEHIRNLVALQDPGVRITAIVDPHKPSQDAGLAAAADAGWKDVKVNKFPLFHAEHPIGSSYLRFLDTSASTCF